MIHHRNEWKTYREKERKKERAKGGKTKRMMMLFAFDLIRPVRFFMANSKDTLKR
jgi:hypothetical protein